MFWGVTGRTMLRDEAHAFLQAGAAIESADMVLRMLRVALPLGGEGAEALPARRPGARAAAGRRRLPGLPPQRPAPPNAGPVARFLLFERDYPDASRSRSRRCTTRSPPPTRATAARPPVLRLSRMIADLDFRARAAASTPASRTRSATSSSELAQVDADIAHRYFGGPVQPVARPAAA